MTKLRPPLSVNQALDRIAGLLPNGWTEMAARTERAERTVRNWGDPDTPESIPMDCAIVLDMAYQDAGGVGAPIHDVYALLLKTSRENAYATQAQLARATIVAIRENADATAAQIACTQPGTTPAEHLKAMRETEEAIAALTHTLALLRQSQPP